MIPPGAFKCIISCRLSARAHATRNNVMSGFGLIHGRLYIYLIYTKVFRTELGHKYILVECSVIALCLPVVSKLSRYKLVCYRYNNDRYEHKTYISTKLMPCFKTFREIHPWSTEICEKGMSRILKVCVWLVSGKTSNIILERITLQR